jgi:GNAT superfamily N-acetyltransferase
MLGTLTPQLTQQELRQRGLTVCPIRAEDEEFLYSLYASSRAEELALVQWDEAMKEQFLRMQFMAQHKHYHEHFLQPDFLLILLQGEPIGRIYIDRRPSEICLAEITLLPEYRSQGIGSLFIQDLMAEATTANLPLRLHVEHFNRARGLYDRLGFQVMEDSGVYLQLEWLPQTLASG